MTMAFDQKDPIESKTTHGHKQNEQKHEMFIIKHKRWQPK